MSEAGRVTKSAASVSERYPGQPGARPAVAQVSPLAEAAGNLAVGRLLAGAGVGRASAAGRPSDSDNHGAYGDDVAILSPLPFIHRKCAACASGTPCGTCDDEKT